MTFHFWMTSCCVLLFVWCFPVSSPALQVMDLDEDSIADSYDRCPNSPPGVLVDPRGCAVDLDRDGIPDYRDICPDTPKDTEVNHVGCLKGQVGDSDGDGVDDDLDRCAQTPVGVPVNRHGCPQDSDRDLVFNFEDQCPNTAAGVPVDATGCALTESLQLYVNLDLAVSLETAQTLDDHQQLSIAAEFLRNQPLAGLLVEGHTDNVGSSMTNMKISQVWAVYIRSYLIEKYAMDSTRVTARGYGATRPLGPEAILRGWLKNQRVEITLVQK